MLSGRPESAHVQPRRGGHTAVQRSQGRRSMTVIRGLSESGQTGRSLRESSAFPEERRGRGPGRRSWHQGWRARWGRQSPLQAVRAREQLGAPGPHLPAPPAPAPRSQTLSSAPSPGLPPPPIHLPAGLGALSLKEQDVSRPGPARPRLLWDPSVLSIPHPATAKRQRKGKIT